MNFNTNHPEKGADEVFITNTDLDGFNKIGWKTKRAGKTAYDICGKKFSGYPDVFPVFANKSEAAEPEDSDK